MLLMLVPPEKMIRRMWTTALWEMRMAVRDDDMFFEWDLAIVSTPMADGIWTAERRHRRDGYD